MAEALYNCPFIGDDNCGASVCLPPVSITDCPADYNAHESEICDVWVQPANADGSAPEPPGALGVNWHDPSAHTGVGVRHLITIGDKPASEIVEVSLAKRQTKVSERKHILNIDVTDMSIPNYDFIRGLQFQPSLVIWYRDIDGYMYGGSDGIYCDVQNAGNIANRGEGGLLTGQVILSWTKLCDPPATPEGVAYADIIGPCPA